MRTGFRVGRICDLAVPPIAPQFRATARRVTAREHPAALGYGPRAIPDFRQRPLVEISDRLRKKADRNVSIFRDEHRRPWIGALLLAVDPFCQRCGNGR